MSDFTKGQWEIGYGKGGITGPTVPNIDGPTIGEVVESEYGEKTIPGKFKIVTVNDLKYANSVIAILPFRGKEETEANARLISTAPLGYKLAEMILEASIEVGGQPINFHKWGEIVASARQIKDKADGKG